MVSRVEPNMYTCSICMWCVAYIYTTIEAHAAAAGGCTVVVAAARIERNENDLIDNHTVTQKKNFIYQNIFFKSYKCSNVVYSE